MSDVFLDIVRPLIGSFAGASLAFLSNLYFQKKEFNRKNTAAGYVALAIARSQYNDFLVVKRGFFEEKLERIGVFPDAPIWLQSRPIHFYFSDGLKFNYESLTSLLGSENSDLLLKFALIEKQYYDLAKLISVFNAYSEKIQEKLSQNGIAEDQSLTLDLALKCFKDDHDLKGKVSSIMMALNDHFEKDEEIYVELIDILRKIIEPIK